MAKTIAKRKRDNWAQSVLRVGDGRGFVVEAQDEVRFVITAGHCLPALPPSHPASHTEERTYAKLIGPLGEEPAVWVECVFVNPVDDLAVLASPDNQELAEEADRFEAFLASKRPLPIASLTFARPRIRRLGRSVLASPEAQCDSWILSLEGEWFCCRATSRGRSLGLEGAAHPIQAGMSGSPIVSAAGAAIGVICTSGGTKRDHHTGGGPNPELAAQLPAWLLRRLGHTSVALRLAEDVARTSKRSR
jgi:hypothetical protein